MFSWFGSVLSEAGQSLSRTGNRWQGKTRESDLGVLHRRVIDFGGYFTKIGQGTWVAPTASVIGAVNIGKNSTIWYGAIIRADLQEITIGENTDIGDRVVIHETSGTKDTQGLPTIIGNNVLIEPNSLIHACTIQDEVKVGYGSIILDGAVMENNTVLESGSLLTKGKLVPSGEVWGGNPARFIRKLTEEDKASIKKMAENWRLYSKEHQHQDLKSESELEETRENLVSGEELGVVHPEYKTIG